MSELTTAFPLWNTVIIWQCLFSQFTIKLCWKNLTCEQKHQRYSKRCLSCVEIADKFIPTCIWEFPVTLAGITFTSDM